ncbi:MAG: YaaC family protein [Pyrinomonadaceae bacterium]
MGFKPITLNGKEISIHKGYKSPNFGEKNILTDNPWNYVEFYLKRNSLSNALFFWNQAKNFYNASELLDNVASPLTSYYCCLNATKALLLSKSKTFSNRHGVSGWTIANRTTLNSEKVKFKNSGILSSLCLYFDEPANNEEYSLYEMMYNMPFIHRAFDLTYKSPPELFIPIQNLRFVKKNNSTEAWFCAEICDKKYQTEHILNKLPPTFEKDNGVTDKFIIRKKKRFKWQSGQVNKSANLSRLTSYHKTVRKDIYCIQGRGRTWYIKRAANINQTIIERKTATLIFAALHKLSELSRYSPDKLSKHFTCLHNWVLNDFLELSLYQFIDTVASEITGNEFVIPNNR